jgi:hypothetical protein
MLGLGHGVNKSVIRKKYALDYIPGGVENNVLWLSYYQMTGRRNDECFRLRDLITSDEWDIGRINGYVDYNRVLTLLSGHTGLCTKIYNNTFASGAQDAIQVDVANMPVVAEGGVFHHNGFKFDAASNNYMIISNYNALSIVEPSFSLYLNYFPNSSNGYIFAKNLEGAHQFSAHASNVLNFYSGATTMTNAHNDGAVNKMIGVWKDKNANGLLKNINGNQYTTTQASTLTNYTNVQLGARQSLTVYASFMSGNIKTVSISADNLYNYYNILAARC